MLQTSPSTLLLLLLASLPGRRDPPRFHVTFVPIVPVAASLRTAPEGGRTVSFLNFRSHGGAPRRSCLYRPAMTTALYNRDILRLAASIPHLGRLERPQGSADKRSPVCGSRVAVDVVVVERGRVVEIGQEVKACALGQASAALMGADAIGRSAPEFLRARDDLAAFLDGRSNDPGDWPGLELFRAARPHKARHPSILLAFDAVAEAAAKALPLRLRSGQA